MTTSGTVGATQITTDKLIEHALRRCGVQPSMQTPETVEIAQNSLFLLLTSLSNRGINLWCVEKDFVGLTAGQATYALPTGTIDALNVIYTQPTQATGTNSTGATSITTALTGATTIVRVGIKMTAVTASDTLTLSCGGITFKTVTRTDWAANTWYWYDCDPQQTGTVFQASFTGAATFSQFYLASTIYDLPVAQWSRDTYSVLPNKQKQGQPATNYYFEKLVSPRVTLWPVPNNSYDHLTVFVHRQPQDVGTLQQTIEVPNRWLDAVIWLLARAMGTELPNIDPARLQIVLSMAEQVLLTTEWEEQDGAPFFLTPGISVYTR